MGFCREEIARRSLGVCAVSFGSHTEDSARPEVNLFYVLGSQLLQGGGLIFFSSCPSLCPLALVFLVARGKFGELPTTVPFFLDAEFPTVRLGRKSPNLSGLSVRRRFSLFIPVLNNSHPSNLSNVGSADVGSIP